MFCCIHDPALALFLAETPAESEDHHVVEWVGVFAGVGLALVLLALLVSAT